jgi:pyruvate/oxaloacetate carboxyltransferase
MNSLISQIETYSLIKACNQQVKITVRVHMHGGANINSWKPKTKK